MHCRVSGTIARPSTRVEYTSSGENRHMVARLSSSACLLFSLLPDDGRLSLSGTRVRSLSIGDAALYAIRPGVPRTTPCTDSVAKVLYAPRRRVGGYGGAKARARGEAARTEVALRSVRAVGVTTLIVSSESKKSPDGSAVPDDTSSICRNARVAQRAAQRNCSVLCSAAQQCATVSVAFMHGKPRTLWASQCPETEAMARHDCARR